MPCLGRDDRDGCAIARARRVDLANLTGEALRSDYLFVTAPPEGAESIQQGTQRLYARGHLPRAVNRAPEEVLAGLRRLDKRRTHVLDCAFGTVSAHLARGARRPLTCVDALAPTS